MRELEAEALFPPSELLVRCHAFLDEIGLSVSPKYPGLEFELTDLTEARIGGLGAAIESISTTTPGRPMRESLIRQVRHMANREDRLSAVRYLAIVNISGNRNGGYSVAGLKRAAGEVEEIAMRYQARKVMWKIGLDESPTIAHFLFAFIFQGETICLEDLL